MFAVRVTGTGQTTNGRSNDKVAVENDVLSLSKGKSGNNKNWRTPSSTGLVRGVNKRRYDSTESGLKMNSDPNQLKLDFPENNQILVMPSRTPSPSGSQTRYLSHVSLARVENIELSC